MAEKEYVVFAIDHDIVALPLGTHVIGHPNTVHRDTARTNLLLSNLGVKIDNWEKPSWRFSLGATAREAVAAAIAEGFKSRDGAYFTDSITGKSVAARCFPRQHVKPLSLEIV